MTNVVRALMGMAAGILLGAAMALCWCFVLFWLSGGGIDYPEINFIGRCAVVTGLVDGVTLLLAGGGALGEGFIKGWTQGLVVRMATVFLAARVPGDILWWAVCFVALFAPLVGGLWRGASASSR